MHYPAKQKVVFLVNPDLPSVDEYEPEFDQVSVRPLKDGIKGLSLKKNVG